MPRPFDFLSSRTAQILTAALVIQAALLYGFSRKENVPQVQPLSKFPQEFAGWRLAHEGQMDQATLDVLRADDVLTRTYLGNGGYANLFIAFFKSQRAGQAPHSPKNCLPGSGWVPEVSDRIPIALPDGSAILVNRYIVQKGEDRSLVLYWYQSHNRVIASEYTAKAYVVADAIRYNRTDTALVRIVVTVPRGDSRTANELAQAFVKAAFPVIKQALPA
ncbi:MAG TPA: EpsI family protein [Solibacterales bacterium]|nr:EpsI family protein [Bryobacterales bacterium]